MLKQVIVMRKDLKMRRGKEIAQGAHAAMAFLLAEIENDPGAIELDADIWEWINSGHTKVCVRIDSEIEMMEIYHRASMKGLRVQLITDSGRTEFNGVPTRTCLAIGPNEDKEIDPITGHLSLY